ncbi:helix-turn-helix domain-containing protein [Fibrobacterota bacterium]
MINPETTLEEPKTERSAGTVVPETENLIKKVRLMVGMTQEELASRLRITQQVVSRMEHNGGGGNTVSTLIRVAEATGTRLNIEFKV